MKCSKRRSHYQSELREHVRKPVNLAASADVEVHSMVQSVEVGNTASNPTEHFSIRPASSLNSCQKMTHIMYQVKRSRQRDARQKLNRSAKSIKRQWSGAMRGLQRWNLAWRLAVCSGDVIY